MKTFMSNRKEALHSQDMKLYAYANPRGAGGYRHRR